MRLVVPDRLQCGLDRRGDPASADTGPVTPVGCDVQQHVLEDMSSTILDVVRVADTAGLPERAGHHLQPLESCRPLRREVSVEQDLGDGFGRHADPDRPFDDWHLTLRVPVRKPHQA